MTARTIRKVLIANRGEIALRVMRTCRQMGIGTVAVFSDADARAPFVRAADEAVRVGPAPSASSYLDVERIVRAARQSGADAIHPGYGFLSERPELAEACRAADVVFIGPSPEAIRTMGSKIEAKRIAAAAGVPIVSGYAGDEQSTEDLAGHVRDLGFPVLLKASAGGGGKGMRIMRADVGLEAAIDSARREADAAFGDGALLVERYIERPRHVEIQILGDAHGNIVHLNERECSIQRRHQKIVEETPSPALDIALRMRMGEAAVRIARAIRYENAGTVELILAPDGNFYFLEVNTRLQVEHPVTEMVTGLDLVREQIRIARGEPLGYAQDEIATLGASIECRLYAEDPSRDFMPSTGRIATWIEPSLVRTDSGVDTGTEIGIHYDPLLAKIVSHGASREEALERMRRALEELVVLGVVTNRALLLRIIEHPEFAAGRLHTHFIEDHLAGELERIGTPTDEVERLAALVATLVAHEERAQARAVLPKIPSGYRNNPYRDPAVEYESAYGRGRIAVSYKKTSLGGGRFHTSEGAVELAAWNGDVAVVEDARGHRRRLHVARDGARWFLQIGAATVTLEEVPRFPERHAEVETGACIAPMPGKVVKIRVEHGEHVVKGAALVVLEAMKMEHTVVAAHDGIVERIAVGEGEQVDAEALLVVVTPAGPPGVSESELAR